MRCIGLLRADQDSESGAPPSPEIMERMGPFMEEITKAGVLLATDGLQPSATGKRVRLEKGKATVIDGPFTESKELIASYALLQVKSMDEAVYWTRRFLEVLGGGECEIRPVYDCQEYPSENPPEAVAREQVWREEARRNAARG